MKKNLLVFTALALCAADSYAVFPKDIQGIIAQMTTQQKPTAEFINGKLKEIESAAQNYPDDKFEPDAPNINFGKKPQDGNSFIFPVGRRLGQHRVQRTSIMEAL